MQTTPTQHETPPRTTTRTCVGCRAKAHPRMFVRLVASDDGRVALDARASQGGRGAWVHPTRACVAAAVKRHAAERALKVDVQRDLDAGVLISSLRASFAKRVSSLLLVASRSRALVFGADAVSEALSRTRVPLVLVATDAGAVASAMVEEQGDGAAPRVLRYETRAGLGRVMGRAEVALAALLDTRIAAELATTIDRLAALEDR